MVGADLEQCCLIQRPGDKSPNLSSDRCELVATIGRDLEHGCIFFERRLIGCVQEMGEILDHAYSHMLAPIEC